MNFVKAYGILNPGSFDLKSGKKQFPMSNQHYSSSLFRPGQHCPTTKIIQDLPVPQQTSLSS